MAGILGMASSRPFHLGRDGGDHAPSGREIAVRFAEIAMLAMPFVVFVAWRLLAPSAGPPRILVIAVTATAVVMAGLLLVLWYEDAAPPGAGYVPAQLENGRVLPSRVEPAAHAPGRVGLVAPGRAGLVAPGRAGLVAPGRAELDAPERADAGAPVDRVTK